MEIFGINYPNSELMPVKIYDMFFLISTHLIVTVPILQTYIILVFSLSVWFRTIFGLMRRQNITGFWLIFYFSPLVE